jgi:hypothetical protein
MKSPGDATDVLIEQPASRLMALAVDAALAVGCYFAAFALRFDAAEFPTFPPFGAPHTAAHYRIAGLRRSWPFVPIHIGGAAGGFRGCSRVF